MGVAHARIPPGCGSLFADTGGVARGLAQPPATDPLSLRDKDRKLRESFYCSGGLGPLLENLPQNGQQFLPIIQDMVGPGFAQAIGSLTDTDKGNSKLPRGL
jgi:hypothetical protein